MNLKRLTAPVGIVGLVIALAVPSLGGNIKSEVTSKTPCGDVNIAVNGWVGYYADAYVVGEVLRKRLGCIVNYVYVAEQISWQGFASGQVDVVLENWGHPELISEYIDKLKVAQDAGSIGITGVIGWYVPPWMAKKYPDITNWKNLNKYASLFKTTESGGKGQFLDGDPGFVTNDDALVKNLKLNFKVVYAGSEAALIEGFRSAEAKHKPMIGYFYSPQWFLAEVPLVQVHLPKYSDNPKICPTAPAAIKCDYPPYPLHKIVSDKFAKANSTGYRMIKKFSWTSGDQNLVAKYITADGMTPADAADKWIAANPKKVDAWLP